MVSGAPYLFRSSSASTPMISPTEVAIHTRELQNGKQWWMRAQAGMDLESSKAIPISGAVEHHFSSFR